MEEKKAKAIPFSGIITAKGKKIIAVKLSGERLGAVRESALRQLLSATRSKGIYVSFSVPSDSLPYLSGMRSRLHIIDALGKKGRAASREGVSVLQSPTSLTELSMLLTKLTDTGEYGFLVFDSFSALLVYNSYESSDRFLHYLLNKLRSMEISGTVLFMEKGPDSDRLLQSASSFIDRLILLK